MADGSTQPAACEVVRVWPPADEGEFRDGLSRLASGVAIAACWAGGQPRGLLVSSLSALSTEPPRMMFCVRKAASAHAALIDADAVSLAILGRADRLEAERFSTSQRAHERFDPSAWTLDPLAPPDFRPAMTALAGPVRCRIDGGTHTIFIVDVSSVRTCAGEPLVYFEREFKA